MRCPGDKTLLLAALGELAPNDMRQLDDHVRGCERCRGARHEIEELLSDLGSRAGRDGTDRAPADEFVDRVMTARQLGLGGLNSPVRGGGARRLRIPRIRMLLLSAAAVVVAMGVTAFVSVSSHPHEVIAARGGAVTMHDPGAPRVEVLVVHDDELVSGSGRSLSQGDAFAVRFNRPTQDPYYLAAFAMDAKGEVHWIYPEYVDEATKPVSIALPFAQTDQLMPQIVQLDEPARGPMRVVAVVSRAPLSVQWIEAAVRELPAGRALAAVFPGAVVREWSCQWNGQ